MARGLGGLYHSGQSLAHAGHIDLSQDEGNVSPKHDDNGPGGVEGGGEDEKPPVPVLRFHRRQVQPAHVKAAAVRGEGAGPRREIAPCVQGIVQWPTGRQGSEEAGYQVFELVAQWMGSLGRLTARSGRRAAVGGHANAFAARLWLPPVDIFCEAGLPVRGPPLLLPRVRALIALNESDHAGQGGL